MHSCLEKSADIQKATQAFIKAVKRETHKLSINRAQIEGNLSLFVSSLWDKLETEITSDFKGESRLVERDGAGGLVQGDSFRKNKCHHCKEGNLVKAGFTRNGKQRFLCRSCKRTSREDSQASIHNIGKRQQVMRVYLIFKSYRKVAQVCGVDRRTVANWIKQNGVTILHPRPRKAIKRNNSSA
jgi:transposase-like protein